MSSFIRTLNSVGSDHGIDSMSKTYSNDRSYESNRHVHSCSAQQTGTEASCEWKDAEWLEEHEEEIVEEDAGLNILRYSTQP